MGITVALEHRTTYTFDRLVQVHPHVVRLRPAPHSRTQVQSYSLTVEPAAHFLNWQQDPFGNFMARLVFPERTRELSITVGLVVDMAVLNPFDFFIEEYAEQYGFRYPGDLAADLEPYLKSVAEGTGPGAPAPGPLVRDWLSRFRVEPGTPIVDFLVALNGAVYRDVAYSVRMEPGVQGPDHTLRTARGSCRDSAWLLVSLLRELGLAARFVSGYLIQLAPDRESLDGPSGTTQDFTDLHAWAEVYIPGAGWVGLDATSGLLTGEGHIPLSATPHPSSAAPISGATDPCVATMDFANVVRRVHEDPRITLPYSPAQWDQIDGFGHFVDAYLAEQDVRLTMGGEPTFVSIDDFVAPEWTIDADGPDKRARSGILADRLRTIFSPRGLVQRSQGKWYPGEPLPRWQITLLWRTDGHPLWSRQDLLADPWAGQRPDTPAPHRHRPEASRRLAEALAIGFALPLTQVRPAYEDALARLAAAVRLPAGAPESHDLDTDRPDVRSALVEALDASVDTPTGYVIPLHRMPDGSGWASADWRLRRGRIVLGTGDSPAGLRLPLDSIAWDEAPPEPDVDPLAAVTALQYSGIASPGQAVVVSAKDAPTTAVVIEQRGECVFVFLPPLTHFDDFVELIGVLEQAASVTDTPIVVEGYGPPNDPRLQSLSVTPDPGVIEVNVQPTTSWAEQSDLTTTLYEQARQTRLGTETFAVDGS
ncbi:MAG: transglutaminase family protein, partial [Nakamurella sp.]